MQAADRIRNSRICIPREIVIESGWKPITYHFRYRTDL